MTPTTLATPDPHEPMKGRKGMSSRDGNDQDVDFFTGGEAIHVTGLAAVLIDRIAHAADRINRIAVGRVVGHIAHCRSHLEFRESGEAVRIGE